MKLVLKTVKWGLSVMCFTLTVSISASEISVNQLERFTLAPQIKGLDGYDIRARKIIVSAGGSIPEHGHTTRPGIVYVLSGEIMEYRGNNARLLKAGDSVVEDVSTVHSYRNLSDLECVLIAFDIPTSE